MICPKVRKIFYVSNFRFHITRMPCKKKKYNARFPPARIKKIMQSDEEVGKVAAPVPVIISRGLELFVESLLTKAAAITTARQARTLTPYHLKQCILSEKKFDFLQEVFEKVPDINTDADSDPHTPVNPLPKAPDFAPYKRIQKVNPPVRRRCTSADPIIKVKRPRGRPRKVPKEALPSLGDSDDALEMDLDRVENGVNIASSNNQVTAEPRISESVMMGAASSVNGLQISVQGVPGSLNVTFPASFEMTQVPSNGTTPGHSTPASSQDLDEDYDE